MKLYFPEKFYDNDYRWHIFPLLKGLQNDPDTFKLSFQIVENESESDVVIIPMSWNYYYIYDKVDSILNYYDTLSMDKVVVSFVFGDFGCKVPNAFKGFVFRVGGLKSKLPISHKGIPVFINDPVLTYFTNDHSFYRPFTIIPVVGFCGHAQPFGVQAILEIAKRTLKNALSKFRFRNQDPDQVISTSYFRWHILEQLNSSKRINSNFIIRQKYRAGIKTQKTHHPTTLEFYNNINASDYVVCMRGAGNFSTRLYETLAMGRIPVFVNTDCVLPLENVIDWKQHVVWVEYSERHLIADKIDTFHKLHNETSLNALFLKNRTLWEDYLQLYGFFKSFHYEH